MLIEIEDASDTRLLHYTRLTDMQLRMVTEPASGIFLAEGEKVIRRAINAGLRMHSALMEKKWLSGLLSDIPPEVPVYLGSPEVLRSIVGFRLHRGALAVFERPVPRTAAEVLKGARSALLLEDLVDHTNVGAIFRSAAGLGVDAVLVTARCADPWYRRSVKTSMGAVFVMPWATVPDVGAAVAAAHDADLITVSLEPAASQSLRDWSPQPAMVLVGTEGPGLSVEANRLTDLQLSIPMARQTDSLNVAMATTLACWVLTG